MVNPLIIGRETRSADNSPFADYHACQFIEETTRRGVPAYFVITMLATEELTVRRRLEYVIVQHRTHSLTESAINALRMIHDRMKEAPLISGHRDTFLRAGTCAGGAACTIFSWYQIQIIHYTFFNAFPASHAFAIYPGMKDLR